MVFLQPSIVGVIFMDFLNNHDCKITERVIWLEKCLVVDVYLIYGRLIVHGVRYLFL